MSAHVLGDKDINASIEQQQQQSKDVKSMDYHRQVFQSKMAQEPYVHRKAASAPSSRSTTTTSSPSCFDLEDMYYSNATIITNSSDASSCFAAGASSYPSPPASLASDAEASSSSSSSFSIPSSSPSSASPTPSITAMPRFPTNKSLVASTKQYVSPSDNIMSPCSAKINALRNKHVSK